MGTLLGIDGLQKLKNIYGKEVLGAAKGEEIEITSKTGNTVISLKRA